MIERRSASGVRISGDDYQHLVAWVEAVPAMYARGPWATLELEAQVPASLDDVVIQSAAGNCRYVQAKYAADAQRLLGDELLLEVEGQTTRSLLQKLHAGWAKLRERGATGTIELVTNRSVDPAHEILRLLDARDDSLRRIVDAPPTKGRLATALDVWARHLEVEREVLIEFLRCLRVKAGTGLGHLQEIAEAQMIAAGLVSSRTAVRQGIDAMRQLVTDDVGAITPDQLAERTEHMERTGTAHDALVVIEAIDDDEAAEAATHHLDWRDQYAEETVDRRIVPVGGEAAFQGFLADLRGLHEMLDEERLVRPLARGTLRMAGWFALGYALRAVDGFQLTVQRGPALTRSDTKPSRLGLKVDATSLADEPGDIAVTVGVSLDPTTAVQEFLESAGIAVTTMVGVTVESGPSTAALQDSADAMAVVTAVRDGLRPYLGQGRAHLFLACPAGVAAMLGHTWHRLPSVTVYEHVGPGYVRAFEFE